MIFVADISVWLTCSFFESRNKKLKKFTLNQFWARQVFLFRFSIVRYISYVLWSSWCNDNWILFVINIINIIVALFRKSLCVFHHQFSICISLNIFCLLSLYFRTESYVMLSINNRWSMKNFSAWMTFR